MATSSSIQCLVNGVHVDSISVLDRGVLYGDGVFETIRFVRDQAPLWNRHMARLQRSLQALGIPSIDPEQLLCECRRLIGEKPEAVLRITITRGQGGRAYFPPEAPEPSRILTRRTVPQPVDAVDMIRSSIALNTSPVLAGIKHLNRLEQVLVARQCRQQQVEEALVADPEGWLVEGLSGNLLVLHRGELIAPGPHPAAVWGVGLAWLRQQLNSHLSERPFHNDELRSDDSIWVINSVQGVRPVRKLDGRELAQSTALDHAIAEWKKLFD